MVVVTLLDVNWLPAAVVLQPWRQLTSGSWCCCVFHQLGKKKKNQTCRKSLVSLTQNYNNSSEASVSVFSHSSARTQRKHKELPVWLETLTMNENKSSFIKSTERKKTSETTTETLKKKKSRIWLTLQKISLMKDDHVENKKLSAWRRPITKLGGACRSDAFPF